MLLSPYTSTFTVSPMVVWTYYESGKFNIIKICNQNKTTKEMHIHDKKENCYWT